MSAVFDETAEVQVPGLPFFHSTGCGTFQVGRGNKTALLGSSTVGYRGTVSSGDGLPVTGQ